MAETTELPEPIVVEFHDARKKTFKTLEQIEKFTNTEFETWSEFVNLINVARVHTQTNPATPSHSAAKGLQNHIAQYRGQSDVPTRADIFGTIKSTLLSYQTQKDVITSFSTNGKIILELAKTDPHAAEVLMSRVTNQPIQPNHVPDILAFTAAAGRAGQVLNNLEFTAELHRSLIADISDEWDNIKKLVETNTYDNNKKSKETIIQLNDMNNVFEKHHRRLFRLFRRKHDQAVDNLSNLENTYHKQLQLEAPATYWADRKYWHKVFSILSATAFLAGLLLAFRYGLEHAQALIDFLPKAKDGTVGLGGIAVLTLPAAAVAWALRIFTRTFSNNLNLSTDAAQRETMITTYLALANDPKANLRDEERILILNAIFRPSESQAADDAPPPNLMELAKSMKGSGT